MKRDLSDVIDNDTQNMERERIDQCWDLLAIFLILLLSINIDLQTIREIRWKFLYIA